MVGRDAKTDLALLKVKGDGPFPHIVWGDSDKTRVGDWILAVGNPFGLNSTVTAGIVSAAAQPGRRRTGRFSPGRCADQQGQLRRPDLQHGRRGDRREHGDLFADRRQRRPRLRHSVQHGARGDRTAQERRQNQPRLARRADPGCLGRYRQGGRPRKAARRPGRRRDARQPGRARRRAAQRQSSSAGPARISRTPAISSGKSPTPRPAGR